MPPSDNHANDVSFAKLTSLLGAAGAGDPRASADLLPLVYEQLRAMAGRHMYRERPDHTLQATALVHEAYVRLVDGAAQKHWESRWQFFAAAAEAMRRILVDRARARARLKRGGRAQRVELESLELTVHDPPDELLALDEALAELAREHPEKARLVNLRYFAGLTHAEAAEALGISVSTADRHWAYARAWLYRRMAEAAGNGEAP
jgi:RNA polymerase sigma factor (TIGR02999 family)